jgi:1-acyl-sn-glycerol-3-phosphate acyltransferase
MVEPGLGSPLKAFTRLTLYVGFTLPLMAWQRMALALNLPVTESLPVWYHRQCCRILGIAIKRRGRLSRKRPTLFAANHVSYLDIAVLGALVRGSFVAKSEVRDWPLFGLLAKLQSTVFVERRVRRAMRHRDEMAERLAAGRNLILFPEGTSSDGNRVLPFKSALLSVAEVRPAVLRMVRRYGLGASFMAIGWTRAAYGGGPFPSAGDAGRLRHAQGAR